MTPDDPRHPHDQGHEPPSAARGPDPAQWDVDDVASALLDGALSPEQATAARARPDVMARAAAMDAARSAARAVPPADPLVREQAIAAALAAFDADTAGTHTDASHPIAALSRDDPGRPGGGAEPWMTARPGAPAPDPRPGDLAAHRDARARPGGRRTGPPRWLAVAAVAAALAGVAGVLAVADRGGDQNTASQSTGGSATEESEASDSAGGDGAAEGQADSSAEPPGEANELGDAPAAERDSEGALADLGDLGSFSSDDDLVERVAALFPTDTDAQTAPSGSVDELLTACGQRDLPSPFDDPDTPLRLHGRGRLDGETVDVWVADGSSGPRVMALGADCTVVVDRPLN